MASRRKKKVNTGKLSLAKSTTIGIVVAKWHDDITLELLKGAKKTLKQAGIKAPSIKTITVPGSFELPLGAQWLVESGANAIICLGCVIKGETPHFDFISQAVSHGIMQLNLKYNIPIIFGVLTTNTLQQAKERSGGKHGNKGADAAIAVIEMLEVRI